MVLEVSVLPYCHRCGTKLDDSARFCQKCGTPVVTYAPAAPAKPVKPLRKEPLVIAAIVLIAILVAAVILSAIVFAPFSPVSFNQTNQDSHSGINTLDLNFQANTAQVTVITQNINNQNILIITSANGSRSIFGSNNPIEVTFTNQTIGNTLTINSKVTERNEFPTTGNLHVTCAIYVNPALKLNINVTTQAGSISLNAEKSATFQSINLNANAGEVQANLQNATIAGDVFLNTQAGAVNFGVRQATLQGNQTATLHSNAGSVRMDITQTKNLQANLKIKADTELGSVNVALQIDHDVGAKIISQTNLGSIHLDVQHFSGNQSPIQSDNYPAASNIEINSTTNFGSININAVYQSSNGPNLSN
ncbi:MAG TPA: zinc ribbon domain-containing protein [Candidatus Bathyarchaeia archaeon]